MDKPLPLTPAAEREILERMLSETPDDVAEARPPTAPRQIRGISLRELGIEPVAIADREPTAPSGAVHTDEVYHHVMSLMGRLDDVVTEAKRLEADRRLSPEGRVAGLTGAWAPVKNAVGQLEGVLIAEQSGITSTEAELFALPAIEPANVVAGLRDMEIRGWFDKLDPDTRLRYAREMHEGQHKDIIAALARSPIPGLHREFAMGAWRWCAERSEPQRVQGIAKRRDRLEWAQGAMRSVNSAMSEWHRKNAQQLARAA